MFKIIFCILIFISPAFASPTWEEKNADKPYFALVNEYDLVINEDYSNEEVYHARIKVQNQEALELGEWPVYYNSSREEISNIKAFTELPDGKKIFATEISDQEVYHDAKAFSDMRVKIIKLPQVAIGSIIDITIKSKTLTKSIPLSFWHTVPLPVIPTKYARYVYSFPTSMPIRFNSYLNTTKPVIKDNKGRTTYTLVLENTDYQMNEEFLPPIDDINGVLSFSSINDWKEIADWYRDQINKATIDDADLSVKTLELIKGKSTETDKARVIIEFIQDHFKYISMSAGDHGVNFHPTNEIFANAYGDAKDLTLITRQMFALAGIKSNVCLFSGEFNGNPQHSLPNPDVFDHLILQTTLDGKKLYIDSQAKGFDFGQLPSSYDQAHILVIEDRSHYFDKLPISNEDQNLIESSSNIIVNLDGTAVFDVKVTLPYEASVQFKHQWTGLTPTQQEQFFQQLQTNFTQGGKIISRQVYGANDRYGRISFDLKYEAPNAYPVVNDMILLRESDQSNLPELPKTPRKLPIFFSTNSLIKNVNTYQIPSGYTIDAFPESFDLDNDFMQVTVKYTKKADSIMVESLYRSKRLLLEAKRYDELIAFHKKLLDKNNQYIVLKRKSNINPQAKEWIKSQ